MPAVSSAAPARAPWASSRPCRPKAASASFWLPKTCGTPTVALPAVSLWPIRISRETEVKALRGLNLELHRGEFTALVGASGSGKSTLLNLVGCLDEPDRGRILLDGRDVAHLSDEERSRTRNRSIGFIFQSFNLVSVLSVYQNVELPLLLQVGIPTAERRRRAQELLG